jgi:hypothetical protein
MRPAIAAMALLLGTACGAAEIEGISLPPRVQLGAAGPELTLNGAGVRTLFLFKIYLAALYLPAKTSDSEAILRSDQPLRFVMHLLRDLSAERINGSINDALRETLTPEQRQPLEARMARFSHLLDVMGEIKEGTRIALNYLPAVGTIVRINGEEKDRIPGADFFQALLRVWLGDRARDPGLRKALLGVDTN